MVLPAGTDLGPRPFRIAFGGPGFRFESAAFHHRIAVPVLWGDPTEELFGTVSEIGPTGGVSLFDADGLVVGVAEVPFQPAEVDLASRRLYQRILKATENLHLYRIWNYVPQINESTFGLENYRAFCRGRSHALEETWGADYKRRVPAGSAVGCDDDRIVAVFAAGEAKPQHFENPEQIPAYEYPAEHGPRAPSFSRASRVNVGDAEYAFISGTSSIKGHGTVAPGNLAGQIHCTVDNLRLVSAVSGVGEGLGAGNWSRHFKVYLRSASDLPAARSQLEGSLLLHGDRVTWLRSDICRAALDIEIEATLIRS